MDDPELQRYSRHILLDQIGIEGQQRLLGARMLVVGVGGLGSPAALYLASAGVGRLTLVDADRVDLTNLQRQILHTTARIGQKKTQSARTALGELNPGVAVALFEQRAGAAELDALVADCDIVLDCSDNFVTRHAVNRACVAHRRPLVSGAAIRFDGQLAVFDLRRHDSPCYACLFPPSQEMLDEACATMGVFAPLTGIIGCLQASEALKLAAGLGSEASGRLLIFEALDTEWRTLTIGPDPACPVCGAAAVNATRI